MGARECLLLTSPAARVDLFGPPHAMFLTGLLQFQIDYPIYAHSAVTWALVIVAIIGYGGTIAYLVWRLVRSLVGRDQQLMGANAELAGRGEVLRVYQIEHRSARTRVHRAGRDA